MKENEKLVNLLILKIQKLDFKTKEGDIIRGTKVQYAINEKIDDQIGWSITDRCSYFYKDNLEIYDKFVSKFKASGGMPFTIPAIFEFESISKPPKFVAFKI